MSELFKKQLDVSAGVRLARFTESSPLPSALRRWNDPTVEMALWERSWGPDLVRKLDAFTFAELPRATFRTRLETAEVDVAVALAVALADGKGDKECVFTALSIDIENLIARFSCATGADGIDVRLQAIRDDACTLFHTDRTRARLVTTYLGPGTEWVPEAYAAEALQLQGLYDGPILRMPRFGVGLFQGALSGGGGLVHRSPRISGNGKIRLFLSLTEICNADA